MISTEMKADLTLQYGNHEYDYPLLSDKNVRSVILKHGCKTFEELDEHCRFLNQIVKEIEDMKGNMHE